MEYQSLMARHSPLPENTLLTLFRRVFFSSPCYLQFLLTEVPFRLVQFFTSNTNQPMRVIYIFLTMFCLFFSSYSQDFNKFIKKTASDREALDRFGMATDISGGYAIVGASLEDHDALGGDSLAQAGSAYIFGRGLGGNWTQVAKLVASDRAAQDRFGFSVAIFGERAVVGATNKSIGGNQGQGAAYIFERQTNGQWIEVAKLTYPTGEALDNFGNAVALNEDKVVVGSAYADPDGNRDAGRAHVFEQDTSGTWVQTAVMEAADKSQGDTFGSAVAVDSNWVAVGAWLAKNNMPSTNDDDAGAVYLFQKDTTTGQWSQQQKVTPDSMDWITGDLFGGTLALKGGTLVVGADGDDVDENLQNLVLGAGSVHIFEKNPNGIFVQVQKITASDREMNASFGQKISLVDNKLLVGAPGETEKVGNNDPNGLTFAGAAYLFEKNSQGIWEEVQRLLPYDREEFDSFGFSLAMTNNYLIISSNQDDENEIGQDSLPNAGSVYLIETCTLDKSVNQTDNTLSAALGGAFYQWVDCNDGYAAIPGATMQSFTPDSSGNFAVELIDQGCFVTSECTEVMPTSLKEAQAELAYLIYPNPSNGVYFLETRHSDEAIEVEIFGQGSLIKRLLFKGKTKYQVDFTGFPSGIYVLKVGVGEKSYTQKLSLIR